MCALANEHCAKKLSPGFTFTFCVMSKYNNTTHVHQMLLHIVTFFYVCELHVCLYIYAKNFFYKKCLPNLCMPLVLYVSSIKMLNNLKPVLKFIIISPQTKNYGQILKHHKLSFNSTNDIII